MEGVPASNQMIPALFSQNINEPETSSDPPIMVQILVDLLQGLT
jgi:hypothetical protein